MGDMLIRNIPDALKQDIARAAQSRNESLSAIAIDLLRKGLVAVSEVRSEPKRSAWDVLRSTAIRTGAIDDDGEYARIMEQVEAERKRDFGRPLPDFE